MMAKVVAYYTNDFYQQKSSDLSLSLNRFGVTYEIKKVEGPETWAQAVSYKPKFILDSLLASTSEYLLYTDADSKLLRAIPWQDLVGDVAYVPFQRSPNHEEEALTGTMAFKNTLTVRAFMLAWIESTPKFQHTFTPEQHSFKEVMAGSPLQFQKLPPEWCFIFDDMREIYPNATPIFEHYQASREFKEKEAKVSVLQREGVSGGHAHDTSEWTRAKGSK